jgi:hypothetical protein
VKAIIRIEAMRRIHITIPPLVKVSPYVNPGFPASPSAANSAGVHKMIPKRNA